MHLIGTFLRFTVRAFFRLWVLAIQACASAIILLCHIMLFRDVWLAQRQHRLLAFASDLLTVKHGPGLAFLVFSGVSTVWFLVVTINSRMRAHKTLRHVAFAPVFQAPPVSFPMNLRPNPRGQLAYKQPLPAALRLRLVPIDPSVN